MKTAKIDYKPQYFWQEKFQNLSSFPEVDNLGGNGKTKEAKDMEIFWQDVIAPICWLAQNQVLTI